VSLTAKYERRVNMIQFKCVFSVDGRRTEEIVSAKMTMEAKAIIESKYRGCKITWWSCSRIN
jgi:hypothetical protein